VFVWAWPDGELGEAGAEESKGGDKGDEVAASGHGIAQRSRRRTVPSLGSTSIPSGDQASGAEGAADGVLPPRPSSVSGGTGSSLPPLLARLLHNVCNVGDAVPTSGGALQQSAALVLSRMQREMMAAALPGGVLAPPPPDIKARSQCVVRGTIVSLACNWSYNVEADCLAFMVSARVAVARHIVPGFVGWLFAAGWDARECVVCVGPCQVDKDDVDILGIGVFGGRGDYKGSIALYEGMRMAGLPLAEGLVTWKCSSNAITDVRCCGLGDGAALCILAHVRPRRVVFQGLVFTCSAWPRRCSLTALTVSRPTGHTCLCFGIFAA
jgi:hypothetical protein